jgi:hypothetical protein
VHFLISNPFFGFNGLSSAPGAGTNRDDMKRINDVEQPLCILNEYIVPAHEDKFRMSNRKQFPVGDSDDQGALPDQLLPNQFSIHASFIALMRA